MRRLLPFCRLSGPAIVPIIVPAPHNPNSAAWSALAAFGALPWGPGLGRAIVKHILNRHRGLLEVESTPGQGSCFTVFLPRAEEERGTPGS